VVRASSLDIFSPRPSPTRCSAHIARFANEECRVSVRAETDSEF
jgi:hypothetical protein